MSSISIDAVKYTPRQKFVSVLSSVALAATMIGVAPAAALAADAPAPSIQSIAATGDLSQYGITLKISNSAENPWTCALGDSINIGGTNGDGGDYFGGLKKADKHLEFALYTNNGVGTINKRGTFTSKAVGVAQVAVYVHEGTDFPSGQSAASDGALNAEDPFVVYIEVTEDAVDYGYQGVNQSILMTSPEVTGVSGSNEDGWVNELGALTPDADGNLVFNYSMSSGIGQLNFATYVEINAGNIALCDEFGDPIIFLGEEGLDDVMYLTQQGTSKTNLSLVIDANALEMSGAYQLVFFPEYSAGNLNNPPLKTLGTTITFEFTV